MNAQELKQRRDELQEELQEHKKTALNLFKEAENLHQKALQSPFLKRVEAMQYAFAKQKEAIEEIHITQEIKNKLTEEDCPEM